MQLELLQAVPGAELLDEGAHAVHPLPGVNGDGELLDLRDGVDVDEPGEIGDAVVGGAVGCVC